MFVYSSGRVKYQEVYFSSSLYYHSRQETVGTNVSLSGLRENYDTVYSDAGDSIAFGLSINSMIFKSNKIYYNDNNANGYSEKLAFTVSMPAFSIKSVRIAGTMETDTMGFVFSVYKSYVKILYVWEPCRMRLCLLSSPSLVVHWYEKL